LLYRPPAETPVAAKQEPAKQEPPKKLTLRCSGVVHAINKFTSKPYDDEIRDHEIIVGFAQHRSVSRPRMRGLSARGSFRSGKATRRIRPACM
jgi:hypothetical protein